LIAFLDTEFTDLVNRPRLLSVGLVTDGESNREFYAEVTDRDRIHGASWFVMSAVLPQFGKAANAACPYAAIGSRLAAFFGGLIATLKTGELIELAFCYHLDWELIERAVLESGVKDWESTRSWIRPVNVYDTTGVGAGKRAAEAYYKSQNLAPFSRHHALCDARALRLAYEAAASARIGGSVATCSETSQAISDRWDLPVPALKEANG
jgi:hypothetical protein